MTPSPSSDRDPGGTFTIFLLGAGGLVAYGGLAFGLSFAVERIAWIGNLRSVAAWTPVVLVLWGASALGLRAIERGAPLAPAFGGVFLLGPVLAYMFGRVGLVGAALYTIVPAIALQRITSRIAARNRARVSGLQADREARLAAEAAQQHGGPPHMTPAAPTARPRRDRVRRSECRRAASLRAKVCTWTSMPVSFDAIVPPFAAQASNRAFDGVGTFGHGVSTTTLLHCSSRRPERATSSSGDGTKRAGARSRSAASCVPAGTPLQSPHRGTPGGLTDRTRRALRSVRGAPARLRGAGRCDRLM